MRRDLDPDEVIADEKLYAELVSLRKAMSKEDGSQVWDLRGVTRAFLAAIYRSVNAREPEPDLFDGRFSFITPQVCVRMVLDYESAERISRKYADIKSRGSAAAISRWLEEYGCICHGARHLDGFAGVEVLYTPIVNYGSFFSQPEGGANGAEDRVQD